MKKTASLIVATLLAAPPVDVWSAPELATIRGAVTVASRPLDGIALAFVDIGSGSVYRATSTTNGAYEARVPAGKYVLTTENPAGLVVNRAPALIAAAAGNVVTADVDLAPVAGANIAQIPPTPEGPVSSTQILHDPIGCVVEGQFPLFEANIQPAASVARARVYFRAAQSEAWYYVEMTPSDTGFVGKLPRPKVEASPISYYIQATTTEFGDARTPEIAALVVADASECEDRKMAAFGPPGEVTVFSAATGSAIAPVGFAAGGVALTAGALALLIGGAAAVGLATVVVVTNDTTSTTTTTTTSTTGPTARPTTTTTTLPTPTTTFPPPTAFR